MNSMCMRTEVERMGDSDVIGTGMNFKVVQRQWQQVPLAQEMNRGILGRISSIYYRVEIFVKSLYLTKFNVKFLNILKNLADINMHSMFRGRRIKLLLGCFISCPK